MGLAAGRGERAWERALSENGKSALKKEPVAHRKSTVYTGLVNTKRSTTAFIIK